MKKKCVTCLIDSWKQWNEDYFNFIVNGEYITTLKNEEREQTSNMVPKFEKILKETEDKYQEIEDLEFKNIKLLHLYKVILKIQIL